MLHKAEALSSLEVVSRTGPTRWWLPHSPLQNLLHSFQWLLMASHTAPAQIGNCRALRGTALPRFGLRHKPKVIPGRSHECMPGHC